jgi:hypothetical protein
MEKLRIPLIVITVLCVLFLPSSTAATTHPACEVKFHNLGRYKQERWGRVFRDREVAPVLKSLLGKDYHKLIDSMNQASYPEDPKDSLSFVDNKGVLTLRGFVPRLFTIMEAMLIVEPCGNVYAAILDEGKRFLYFSNDKEHVERMPAAIEQWRSGIEKARSGFEKKPELPVVFKSK